jgi:hypothetical protein
MRNLLRSLHPSTNLATTVWHKRFSRKPPLDVAVNLSVGQCRKENTVRQIAAILEETGMGRRDAFIWN